MKRWKTCEGFSQYEISENGDLRTKSGKSVKACKTSKGYLHVSIIDDNGCTKSKYIHRLVAENYIDNPNSYPCVNHKDENKENNTAENLEWCTHGYNNAYGTAQERIVSTRRKNHLKKLELCYTPEQVGKILPISPQKIREQARAEPWKLGFDVIVTGNRTLIPKASINKLLGIE